MTTRSISDEIEALSAERRALWAAGINGDECDRLSRLIDALYDEKRRAAAPKGSEAARKKAIRDAVAEREYDRLMST